MYNVSKTIKKNTHFICYPYTLETTKVFLNDEWIDVGVIKEEQFLNGTKIKGPLLIIENNQTIFVEDGWETKFVNNQFIILDRINEKNSR